MIQLLGAPLLRPRLSMSPLMAVICIAAGCQPARVVTPTPVVVSALAECKGTIVVGTARKVTALPYTYLLRTADKSAAMGFLVPRCWVTFFTVDRAIAGDTLPGMGTTDGTGNHAVYVLTGGPVYREGVQYIIDITMATPPAVYLPSDRVIHLPPLEWSAEREEAIRWLEGYFR